MKIIFVMSNWKSLSGGVRVIATYANRLQKRGHEVFVVSPERRKSCSFAQRVRTWIEGVRPMKQHDETFSYFDESEVPRKMLDHPPPVTDADLPDADVVIAAWWETAEWVANLSESKGAKAYFIQHHEVHDYLPKERVVATYSLPLHKIVVSKWLLSLMQNQYKDFQVSYVPNSVDFEKFNAPPRGKQTVPTVGMLYSKKAWKGCDVSLKACTIAAEKVPDLHLVAFGTSEPSKNILPPLTCEYFCRPPQERIKEIYARCDAWLFGSYVEGFGLPLLESMACRTPVIGTPAGAAPELLDEGSGVLVRVGDPEDMARAIVRIHSLSDSEWRLMSDAAYSRARRYTWEDATDLFERALMTAIERGGDMW